MHFFDFSFKKCYCTTFLTALARSTLIIKGLVHTNLITFTPMTQGPEDFVFICFFSGVFGHIKTSLQLLQLFRRMLQRCLAVKLQK